MARARRTGSARCLRTTPKRPRGEWPHRGGQTASRRGEERERRRSLATFALSLLLHAGALAAMAEVVTSPPLLSRPAWDVSPGGITIFLRPPPRSAGPTGASASVELDMARSPRPWAPAAREVPAGADGMPGAPVPVPELALDRPAIPAPEAPALHAGSRDLRELPPLPDADAPAPLAPAELPEPMLPPGVGGWMSEAVPDGSRNRPPIYPAEARRERWEGTVILRVDVDAGGSVLSCEVATTSGHPVLDEAARAAVRRWRFAPARLDGRAVPSRVELPVRFKLES